MNKDNLVCRGMLFKIAYRMGRSTRYTYCVVVEVFSDYVEMLNLYTGNVYPKDIQDLRDRAELIGCNYKRKK